MSSVDSKIPTSVATLPASFEPLSLIDEVCGHMIREVKEKAGVDGKDEGMNDITIFRYMKGWKYDVQKTSEMVAASVKFRAENKASDVRAAAKDMKQEQFPNAGPFMAAFPHTVLHGFDKKGQPVSLERTGYCDPAVLVRSLTLDELLRYHLHHMENKAFLMNRLSQEQGKIVRINKIMDLSGLGLRHVHTEGLRYLRALLTLSQDHYPEMLGTLFIVNSPWVFHTLWHIIKPWLNEATISKIQICGPDFKDVLLQHLDIANIPEYLGGECKCEGRGGCCAILDPFVGMTKVEIGRRAVHLVEVDVKEGGTLVSYEFQTLAKDIGFELKFCPEGGETMVVKSNDRVEAHLTKISGVYEAKDKGKATLVFDNSFSMMTGKTLLYEVTTKKKDETVIVAVGDVKVTDN